MSRASLADEIAAVRSLCRKLGLGDVAPTLLKAAHHTTLLILPRSIVARVQSSEPPETARRLAVKELAVTRHLARHGAPVLAPLDDGLAGPHVAPLGVVTLWPYIEHARTAEDADAPLAASTLVSVHVALRSFAVPLPPYTDALDHCWQVLADGGVSAVLPRDDRDLLATHYRRLRHEIDNSAASRTPLHGDVHLGNLLFDRHSPWWIDFEDACVGPVEQDIAGLPSTVWPLFADADQALIQRFAELKSVCVAVWCWADMSRSAEVREAAEYHLQQVRELPL
jgi:hypothetical protein